MHSCCANILFIPLLCWTIIVIFRSVVTHLLWIRLNHYCYISLCSYTPPQNSVHFFCLFSLFYICLKQNWEEQLKRIINGDNMILLNIMVYSTNLHEVYIQVAQCNDLMEFVSIDLAITKIYCAIIKIHMAFKSSPGNSQSWTKTVCVVIWNYIADWI